MADKDSIERLKIDVETALVSAEGETFKADAKVAVEKIFDIATTAPGVVVADVMVERTLDGVAFGGALDEIWDVEVGTVLSVREDVCAPEIQIPFVIAVPLRARRRHDLLNFFSRHFLSRMAIGDARPHVVAVARGHGRFGFGAFATEEP